jgi:pimeloyl-ACP methyl ester carboxylesterase
LQRRRDQQQTLQACRVPTLILSGALDPICPVKRHESMAEFTPRGNLVVLDGVGHLLSLEAPDAVTDALRDWLHARS